MIYIIRLQTLEHMRGATIIWFDMIWYIWYDCRPWSRWGEPPSWEPALPLLCCVIPPLLLSQYTISKKPWTFTQISNPLPIWGDCLSKPSQGWAAVLDFTQSHSAFTLLPLNKFLAPRCPNVTSSKQSYVYTCFKFYLIISSLTKYKSVRLQQLAEDQMT